MIHGVVELPATNLQKRVVNILVDADGGGELVGVLSKRIRHFGFECCDELARNLILKF